MKNEPQLDVVIVLAMAGQLVIDYERVIDYHNKQLRILKDLIKSIPRLKNAQRIQLSAAYKIIARRLREAQETIVTPRTLLTWHQKLIADKWDYSHRAKRSGGRPRTKAEKIQMVLKMAEENPLLGYHDIENRMKNLGWEISYQTVRNILLGHGMEPSKERAKRLGWKQFSETNLDGLYALDFTTVEIQRNGRLETHFLLFVIHIKTRKACFAGRTRHPNKAWVQQILRNLSDPFDGFLKDCTHIIMDNDAQLHPNVVKPLKDIGIKIVRTPIKAPNCNALIERFIQSFKRDALSFTIPRSGSQLDSIAKEYITFYNQERNHQGINNKIIEPQETIGSAEGVINIRARNNGSLKYYYRCAA